MKIKSFAILALLGLVSALEENAEANSVSAAEGSIPWFWNAEDATKSEQKAENDNPVTNKSDDGGAILAACFGLQSCAGFRMEERELIYAARDQDCKVGRTQTPEGRKDSTSALSLTSFDQICKNLLPLDQLPRPYDAMPVTFNYPVIYDTLDVNGDNFIITKSDGTFTRPKCAILDPAGEGNEQHTVALIGHFGGRDEASWPNQIRVVGDLKLRNTDDSKNIDAAGLKLDRSAGGTEWQMGNDQYGHGMAYDSGLVMLKAWMYPFTEKGETDLNHCRNDFPSTTHVIKVMFNGGMTIDGIHPLVPDDTRFFTVMKSRGETLLWNKFLGLADLGTDPDMWKETNTKQLYETDGDNYLDLCIQLSDADGDGTFITAVAIQPGAVFPPRGTGPNIQHMVKVDHIPKGGIYPHNLEMTKFADKLFEIYVAQVFDILGIAGTAGTGVVLVPILGMLMGVGVMFLQSFFPNP